MPAFYLLAVGGKHYKTENKKHTFNKLVAYLDHLKWKLELMLTKKGMIAQENRKKIKWERVKIMSQ